MRNAGKVFKGFLFTDWLEIKNETVKFHWPTVVNFNVGETLKKVSCLRDLTWH